MVPSLEVRFNLQTGDLFWLMFSDAIRKLTYARWILAIAVVILVALGPTSIVAKCCQTGPPVKVRLVPGGR